MSHTERVVILLDMDCFYCQVEEKLNPEYEGKPIAVVQYNEWRGGGIIAVNYPAREMGVTRHMRGEDAKHKCPDIILAKVPQVRGKADLTKYRDAGKRVADVLQTFTATLERASVDEAYLDVTEAVLEKLKNGVDSVTMDQLKNTYVVGYDETEDFLQNLHSTEFTESNLKLCLGGVISEEIRAEVLRQTGYKCSAGIAHNKILAKLACGLHKPNKQTILPQDAITEYFKTVPVRKITGLGGKFGHELLKELEISNMGQLAEFTEKQLVDKFGNKNGSWLYNIARGIDPEPVVTRLISKSIGCCKRFPGRSSLTTHSAIEHWMNELAVEISERLQKDLEENNRKAKQMVISFSQEINNKIISSSRTVALKSYEQPIMARDGIEIVKKSCRKGDGSYSVTFLGMSITNFQNLKKNSVDIASFFAKMSEHKRDPVTIEMAQSEEEKEEEENHSVYSASTEDLEEDPKSYIYFEDIYPEFASSQPLESYFRAEMTSDEENRRIESSESFFAKYFATPVDLEVENVEEREFSEPKRSCDYGIFPYLSEEPNDNYCAECNRNVPEGEVFSHGDYHVAKKLQAELNRENSVAAASNKTLPIKVKSKKATQSQNSTIKNFFKPA